MLFPKVFHSLRYLMRLGLLSLILFGLSSLLIDRESVFASPVQQTGNPSVLPLLNYQGNLRDPQGNPLSGAYNMTFRIYDSVSAATALWTEQINGVTVRNGAFSTLLGATTPLPATIFTAPDRFIGVTVAPYAEMTPRQRLAAVPYAIYAQNATQAFTLSAPDGDPANAVVVTNDGAVGIATTAPSSGLRLDVEGAVGASLYCDQNGGQCRTITELYTPADTRIGPIENGKMCTAQNGQVACTTPGISIYKQTARGCAAGLSTEPECEVRACGSPAPYYRCDGTCASYSGGTCPNTYIGRLAP
jgi:hypothetical protein